MKHSSLLFHFFLCFSLVLLPTHNICHAKQKDGPCSRVANIQSREVMVDLGPRKKGEGLRYYIEKDPLAKSYLDKYQKIDDFFWYSAGLGTLGTVTTLVGMGQPGTFHGPRNAKKRVLMLSGIAILLINFFVVKTLEFNNEKYLLKATEEYNKRNWPKIYFGPTIEDNKTKSISVGFQTSF